MFSTILVAVFSLGISAEVNVSAASLSESAFAVCAQSNRNQRWFCDGPTQRLSFGAQSREAALDRVGCDNPMFVQHVTTPYFEGSARLYRCSNELEIWERDILQIHSLMGH